MICPNCSTPPLAIIGLLYLAAAGLTLVGHGFFMAAPISSNSKGLFQLGQPNGLTGLKLSLLTI